MGSGYKVFLQLASRDLSAFFATHGFHPTGDGQYARRVGSFVHVVSWQVSQDKKACAINLAADLAFRFDEPTLARITEGDCDIRARLSPNGWSADDHWWPIETSDAAERAVLEIKSAFDRHAPAFFDQYTQIPGVFAAITDKDVEDATPAYLNALPSTTLVRGALLLAQMYEHAGDLARAREFAEVGLRNAGLAVGPKRALRDILARVNQG